VARTSFQRGALAAAIAAALAVGVPAVSGASIFPSRTAEPAATAPAAAPVAGGRAAAVDFSEIVDRYGPAVVNVSVSGRGPRADQAAQGMPDDEALREFLRRFGGGGRAPQQRPDAAPVRGQGSGFIVSADGLILTNAHVVDGAEVITVRLTDRREYRAKLVGADPQTDVAVLRIDAKNLPTVKLGDPSKVKVGEPVLAIGSPFGFENTVTSGIVSAKSRSLPDDTYVPFIQTDVAVNPGNSGGPLFDARGEVVGINSQIYSRTGGYEGLSFAIPIDVAMGVQKQLVEHGKVVRGRFGVSIQEMDQSLARAFGLEAPRGALVTGVEPGSPAAKAGLKAGDVIVAVDGQRIDRSAELPARVAAMKPGQKASLDVLRDKVPTKLAIVAGGGTPEATASAEAPAGAPATGRLGLAVRELRPGEAGPGEPGGLLVEAASGPAAQAGIRPGDVILSVDGTPVGTVAQLRERVKSADGDIALLVRRGEARVFVPLRPAA
jgi:serine protease Do